MVLFLIHSYYFAIRLGFRENLVIWHRHVVLNEVPREMVDHDITINYWEQSKDITSPQDARVIVLLVEITYGLFIRAAIACRFVKTDKCSASKRSVPTEAVREINFSPSGKSR